VRATLTSDIEAARETMTTLAQVGISITEVTGTLLDEAVSAGRRAVREAAGGDRDTVARNVGQGPQRPGLRASARRIAMTLVNPASRMTLGRHIVECQRHHPRARGELSVLLMQMALAGKVFSHELRQAAITGGLGATGDRNVQGEATKKLDAFGNDTIVEAFAASELVAAIVSEEMDEPRQVACGGDATYLLCIDPLDGSSNSDVNGVVATIFGIYRPGRGVGATVSVERLRSGRDQVAAGYIMYGPSTIFVYTTGNGVNGFTLDQDIGEFVLTHPDIRCPVSGPYYSANLANLRDWPPAPQAYVHHLASGGGRAYSLRYSGALVADVHRSLLEGGIYLYPPDRAHADGKLRLLYECAPLAFVVEQSGGMASAGTMPVLDLPTESIHQRAPLAMGSQQEVTLFERFAAGFRPA
jgi:fructose-1,6-bisphosphatase I